MTRWIGPLRPEGVEQRDDGTLVMLEHRKALNLVEGETGMVSLSGELLVELLEAAGYQPVQEATP